MRALRKRKARFTGSRRRTIIAGFDRVSASEVAIANETLYLDAKEGFAGYGMKKEGEAIGKCSSMDEVLFITREGGMSVVKVAPKFHVGKNPVHIAIFRRDEQAVYSLIYRDGKQGRVYAKRFRVGGITRDKEYSLTQETAGTKVLYFYRHETEEESNAQVLNIKLRHELRMRVDAFAYKFGDLAIKGRESKGNMVTEKIVEKITRFRSQGAGAEEEDVGDSGE